MLVKHINLFNFRCFSQEAFSLDYPLILIEGLNGSGKSSLLEALHFVCYLRSFRTLRPQELFSFDYENFFIRLTVVPELGQTEQEIQVGFTQKERLIKINGRVIQSYKELTDYYRVVTLTEYDLSLIQAAPEIRRLFIDQAVMLYYPQQAAALRTLLHIVKQRNGIVRNQPIDKDSYEIWSEQLWQVSSEIQGARVQAVVALQAHVNTLIKRYFQESFSVTLSYTTKKIETEKVLREQLASGALLEQEQRLGYSLFGAHLDDISINFQEKKSRVFASRGQQKLVLMLIKIAQINLLMERKGRVIFLLDDFMTDFDSQRVEQLLNILIDLDIQLIFTCPSSPNSVKDFLLSRGAHHIKLSH